MATIAGDFVFTDEEAQEMAETLKNAMDGFGTNEDDIIKVLVTHNNAQRQTLEATYKAAYGKSLMDDLVSELGGDLEETVVALMMPPRDYDAKMLHDAIAGVGTNENTLIGILCSRSNDEIEQIKEAYKRLYECELIEDLQGDTSGYFGRMLYSLASAARQESGADEDRAMEDAQKLIEAGVNTLGTDECDFNSVLCLSSYDQLRCVFDKYAELREGTTIDQDIDSEMSSDLKDGYLSIVKMATDKYGYFAERLYKAMKGWGTDDAELIRVIVSRSEEDLLWVMEKYEKNYEVSLFDAVKDECSSHYQRCLLSIIAGKYIGPDDV